MDSSQKKKYRWAVNTQKYRLSLANKKCESYTGENAVQPCHNGSHQGNKQQQILARMG
jgi:hypothetical protein